MIYHKLCETCDHKFVCKFTAVMKDTQEKIDNSGLKITSATGSLTELIKDRREFGESPVYLHVGCIHYNAICKPRSLTDAIYGEVFHPDDKLLKQSPSDSTSSYQFNGYTYTNCSNASTVVKDTDLEYAPSDIAVNTNSSFNWTEMFGKRFIVSSVSPWFSKGDVVICVANDPVQPYVIKQNEYDIAFQYKPIKNVPPSIVYKQIKDGTYVHSIPIEYLVPVNE